MTLLKQTGQAHHQAFRSTDGVDPDWPIWYALHLNETLAAVLGRDFTRTEIICLLTRLAEEQELADDGRPWPAFYADHIVQRYVAEEQEGLALYYIPSCPFCAQVIDVVEDLGLEITLRDIWRDEQARCDLLDARSRATVPVLRCTAGEVDRWMPESSDIIAFLRRRYG